MALQTIVEAREASDPSLMRFIPRASPGHIAPVHLAPLVELLERAGENERLKICVSIPPGHGKTDLLLHAIVRHIQRHPSQLVGYATYGLELSYPKSREARGIAERAGVKLASDSSAVQEWNTTEGGGFKATAVGAGFTGRHVDLLVIDDPFKNRDEAESPRERDRVWNFYSSTASTRRKANASQVVVHTRWHEDDLIGRLSKLGGWIVVNIPAIRDPFTGAPSDDGEVLLPEITLPSGSVFGYSRAWLDEQRALNEYDWWSLYQGAPRPRGGKVFEKDPVRYEAVDRDDALIVLSVDAAGTENTSSDYTAAVAIAVHGYGATMSCDVLEMLRFQKEPQNAAKLLADFQQLHGGGSMFIESTRDGKAVAKALRGIDPLLRIVDVAPIGDKFTRAQPLASAWNAGRVRVPAIVTAWLAPMLDEFAGFTGLGDKHDDQVDALSQAWNRAQLLRGGGALPNHGQAKALKPASDRGIFGDYTPQGDPNPDSPIAPPWVKEPEKQAPQPSGRPRPRGLIAPPRGPW